MWGVGWSLGQKGDICEAQLVLSRRNCCCSLVVIICTILILLRELESIIFRDQSPCNRGGRKELWGTAACKGHSGAFSLLKCFLGDTGMVGTWFVFDCW